MCKDTNNNLYNKKKKLTTIKNQHYLIDIKTYIKSACCLHNNTSVLAQGIFICSKWSFCTLSNS